MFKKEVCAMIKRLYELLSEQEKQGYGYRFELEKEKEIFFVEELECYVLKGRTTYYCEYDNEQTRNVFIRMDCLLVLIYKILMEDMTVNIRWVQLEFDTSSKEELLLILVVEKDTIFQRLVEEKIHKRFRCIIITGCGMPNVATRTLLRKMQRKLNLPVVALGDHNAGGFNIYLTYLCGSENMAYDSLNLSTPDIKWLGLSPSDLIERDIPNGNEKVQGLETIMKKDFVKKTPKLVEEVRKMETKVDVEGMMRKHLKYLTEIYLPLKFQRLGMSDSV
ncbi:putative DNA topoisomerase (ATP-hydrolyzing) [Rosa chinensis]|uniref:Putative DNA topoisomerase (ATP-hydrolyzing) n=1 Tax=Rosa chinensis TaxID=74649 RepID=A0A2P6R6Q2_ROSCH|nr:putative DNA topoisomerase (ATP-hydrolyzing) [Rosa chinensis]